MQIGLQPCLDRLGRTATQSGAAPAYVTKLIVAIATLGLIGHPLDVGLSDRLTTGDAEDLLPSDYGAFQESPVLLRHPHRVDREHATVVEAQRHDLEHVPRTVRPKVKASNRRIGFDIVTEHGMSDRDQGQ